MCDEANESLPLSSPPLQSEGGDDDGEPIGDDSASPVLRRVSSTGMGSYCKVGKLDGESVLLGDGEARLDEGEVNGGGDRSLEVELGEDEVKGVNLGGEEGEGECQGIRGVEGECRHLGLGKAQEAERADNDCEEFVSGVQEGETVCSEALGVEEGNTHLCLEQAADVAVSNSDFEGCEAETQPASEMVDMSTDMRVEVTDNRPSSDSENGHGKLFSAVQVGEEECKGVLEVKEENVHLASEQPVEVGIAKEEFDSASGDDQTLVAEIVDNGASVDSGSGLGDFILGEKADEEENEHLGLAHELLVESPEPVGVTDAVVFVKGVSGSGKMDGGRKEAAEEPLGISGVEEEIRHLSLKQTLVIEVPKSVTDEEQYEFPGLSPFRTLKTGDFGCSVFGIGSEEGFPSSGVFDNGCEDSELLVSSGLAADCSLVKISRDDSKPADGHCFPRDASQDCSATCTVVRCEKLHCLEAEKGNFGQCSGNELCSRDGNGEGDQFSLKIDQSLSLQYVRSQKEHCGDNISGPYSIFAKEIAGGGEVSLSVQGSPDEVASFPAVHGWKPSHFPTSVENLSSKLSSSPEFQGNEGDVFIGMPACSSNVSGSCGEADNGRRRDPKSSSTIVSRRSNPKRGASLRSNLADNQLCGTRNNRGNGRKTVDISSTVLLSAIKISDKLKRKRSWPHRPACSSVWGPVHNLIKIFNQNVIPVNYDTDKILIQNKWSMKEKSTVVNKKHLISQKDGQFLVSSAKHSVTSVQPVCHILVGLPTTDCQMDFGNFNKVEAEHKLAGDKFFVVRSHKQDGQLGDKDIESSLTQEASVDLGECPGVSSQIAPEMLVETVSDRNSQDPGTSPDSDVYHPVIDVGITTTEGKGSSDQPIGSNVGVVKTSESATSANQFRGMRENVPVQGAVFKDDLHSAVSICSKACVTSLSVPPLDPNLCAKAKRGMVNSQAKEKQCLSEHLSIVEELPESKNMNKNKKPSRGSKSKQRKQDVINEKNRSCSKSMKKTTTKGSKCMSYAMESSVPETAELECLEEPSMVQNCLDSCVLPVQAPSTWQSEALLQIDKTKGHKLSSGTKTGASKGRSHHRETAGQRRQNVHRKMGKRVQESDNRCQDKCQTADTSVGTSDHLSFFSGTVNPTLTMSTPQNCKTNVGSRAVSEDVSSLDMSPLGDLLAPNGSTTSLEQPLSPQVAWVLCDECEKWRCISVELANILEETKCKWTCKDNTDKAFADCSIPQEKSNSEINAELGILDEEDPSSLKASANGVEPSKLSDVAASQRTSWIPIKSNLFLRRNRRTQTIDEIMVCHCKPLQDGHRGCGDQCLNRMLNIECVKGTCPCGDLCSNQQFQKRKYAKFKWFRCGRKGYGLQLQQDVSRGQFLIEYVGEVLDLTTYEKRQSDYASRGQKHFYFMTLNGGEVIDACAKGNLGRFINHSCEPNCRTEKWMVNGEVCIGLFAIRNIKKGEEVTFDYNYVRVVGAAAKKCVCGSSECRGYIGGDPLNSEVIVQGDSDEEDIEPVMVHVNSQRELNQNDSVSDTNDVKVAKHKELSMERKDVVGIFPPMISEPEVSVRNKDDVCRLIPDNNMLDISLQSSGSMQLENTISRPISAIQPLGAWKLGLNSVQVEENVCKPISEIQQEEISLQAPTTVNEVSSDSALYSKKLITNHIEEKPNAAKPHSVTKSSCSRSTIKRGRSNVKSLISHKTKTVTPGGRTSHFEGVEEKLNVLLDVDGGISKQRDATRGYLKLLFVTAAEGDVEDCGSQRNIEGHRTQSSRDLSLILDAILKTKSRKVLMDVINKNGLQMLHNIMKQNRNRIPIIRKLLKVFEFLAHEEILTSELINKAPPCHGMESFKESFLKLANHNDKQVHKIAREFRDKYIPRIRRVEPSDRDGGHLDRQPPYRSWIQSPKRKYQQVQLARDTDAIDTPGETFPYIQQASICASMTDNSSASGIKPCKRKSRWDHPSGMTNADTQSLWSPEDQSLEAGTKFIKSVSPSEQPARIEVSKQTYGPAREGNSSWGEIASSQNLMQLDDERPPGFLDDEGPPGFLDGGPPGFLDEGPLGFLNDEGPPGFFVDEGPPGFEPSEKNHQSHLSSETALVKGEVLIGHPQEIYLSYMTMSYGIPVGLMQQLGTPETGGSPCNQNWVVAPGMPFYPFPPLPSYPREHPNPREERQRVHPASGTDLTLPSTSGGGPTDMVEAGCRNSQFHGRLRWENHGCGRRFHHPQRWSNRRFQRFWPRWPYQKFGRGFRGNTRNGPSNLEVGNMRGDFEGGLCPPDGVNNNGGLSSNFHQPHN